MSEFFDRLTAQVKAWDTEEMPGVDIGLLMTTARKVLAGPSPEAVQAAAKVIYDGGLGTAFFDKRGQLVPFDDVYHTQWDQVAAAALAAAFFVDFGDPK